METNCVTMFSPVMVGTFYRFEVFTVAIETMLCVKIRLFQNNAFQVSHFYMTHLKVWFQDLQINISKCHIISKTFTHVYRQVQDI